MSKWWKMLRRNLSMKLCLRANRSVQQLSERNLRSVKDDEASDG